TTSQAKLSSSRRYSDDMRSLLSFRPEHRHKWPWTRRWGWVGRAPVNQRSRLPARLLRRSGPRNDNPRWCHCEPTGPRSNLVAGFGRATKALTPGFRRESDKKDASSAMKRGQRVVDEAVDFDSFAQCPLAAAEGAL